MTLGRWVTLAHAQEPWGGVYTAVAEAAATGCFHQLPEGRPFCKALSANLAFLPRPSSKELLLSALSHSLLSCLHLCPVSSTDCVAMPLHLLCEFLYCLREPANRDPCWTLSWATRALVSRCLPTIWGCLACLPLLPSLRAPPGSPPHSLHPILEPVTGPPHSLAAPHPPRLLREPSIRLDTVFGQWPLLFSLECPFCHPSFF